MSTAIEIIHLGLNCIGAHSRLNPAQPATLETALVLLGDMLSEWHADEIRIPYREFTEPGDELREPPGLRLALAQQLALRLAPIIRVQVSPELETDADRGFRRLKEIYVDQTPPKRQPRRFKGAGNMRRS